MASLEHFPVAIQPETCSQCENCENAKKKKRTPSLTSGRPPKKISKRGAQMCFISNFRSSMSWAERTHPRKRNHAMNSFQHDATYPRVSLGFHKLSLYLTCENTKKAMDRRNRSHPFLAFRISASKIATLTEGPWKKRLFLGSEKKVLYYCCYSISVMSENVWNTEIMVFKKRPQTCIQNWISILNALHTLTRSYQYFHQNFQHPMLKGAPFFAKNPPKAAKITLTVSVSSELQSLCVYVQLVCLPSVSNAPVFLSQIRDSCQ